MKGKIAVLYDTEEGQTAKIARTIADSLDQEGYQVITYDLRRLPQDFDLETCRGIILGASVHVGKHSPPCTEFVTQNRELLNRLPSAFFSVSLSAAGESQRQQQDAQRVLDEFLSDVDWTPNVQTTLAGALLYRQYGFFKRRLMKWIAKREGGDTDTTRDFEYTDWDEVQRFVNQFTGQLQAEAR
jgi:menaquinone-dependent protoporphyrinogen oxidase